MIGPGIDGFPERVRQIAESVGGVMEVVRQSKMSDSQIYRYISGESKPRVDALVDLARVGGVTVAWLAAGQLPMHREACDPQAISATVAGSLPPARQGPEALAVAWHTAKGLAGLPGLPTTVFRVIERAKREGWLSRPRKGRGGGREYHVSSLPEATRKHLAARAAANNSDDAVTPVPAPAPSREPVTAPAGKDRASLPVRLLARLLARLLRPVVTEIIRQSQG